MTQAPHEDERRTVEVTDPSLSPSTRKMLTDELRQAVGADSVDVPADRADPAGDVHVADGTAAPQLTGLQKAMVICAALCALAGIIGLIAGGGALWAVPLAFGFVVAFALLVVTGVLGLTRLSGRASPTTAAAMEADGIPNPDEYFSAVVDEFTPAAPAGEDHEHRTTAAHEDPAAANREQQSAMTPSSQPSDAVGPG